MRSFAKELKAKDIGVKYSKLTAVNNIATLLGEIARAVKVLKVKNIIVTEPGEYRFKKMIDTLPETLGVNVDVREDDRFLGRLEDFKVWARDKKQLRMEYFYHEMRKKYNILIAPNGKPTGIQWNYDTENRKPPIKRLTSPKRISHPKSTILKQVLKLVEETFSSHFGNLEPFHYAITRQEVLSELHHFINRILSNFGDYQDAMVKGEAYLNHSLLSSYEVCKQAEQVYHKGNVSLYAAEGFIRQILGWREYMRGIYWLKMPEYGKLNYLQAKKPLPAFYWGAKTHMACIAEAVSYTQKHAYSHHIQRLMVTGNFALIAGLDVKEVQEWYLAVYSDAYEWVEMPNTLGMSLFGDGGIVGSKPYAASGKYIHKMSNFCKECVYNPKQLLEEKACAFNALYWDFMARHVEKLKSNPRLFYVYSTRNRFAIAKKEAIRQKAHYILKDMDKGIL